MPTCNHHGTPYFPLSHGRFFPPDTPTRSPNSSSRPRSSSPTLYSLAVGGLSSEDTVSETFELYLWSEGRQVY